MGAPQHKNQQNLPGPHGDPANPIYLQRRPNLLVTTLAIIAIAGWSLALRNEFERKRIDREISSPDSTTPLSVPQTSSSVPVPVTPSPLWQSLGNPGDENTWRQAVSQTTFEGIQTQERDWLRMLEIFTDLTDSQRQKLREEYVAIHLSMAAGNSEPLGIYGVTDDTLKEVLGAQEHEKYLIRREKYDTLYQDENSIRNLYYLSDLLSLSPSQEETLNEHLESPEDTDGLDLNFYKRTLDLSPDQTDQLRKIIAELSEDQGFLVKSWQEIVPGIQNETLKRLGDEDMDIKRRVLIRERLRPHLSESQYKNLVAYDTARGLY